MFLMKITALAIVLIGFAAPVLAFETEDIGMIEATFNGEAITQPTVIARDGADAQATATLFLIGPFSDLSIAGFSLDNRRLGVDVQYMSQQPGPETTPMSLTITYDPPGPGGLWTSDDAPAPPSVTVTTLQIEGEEGRAIGSFAAVLCYAEGYEAAADIANCHLIEGRFDTRIRVETLN
jgi:hypothetical protein